MCSPVINPLLNPHKLRHLASLLRSLPSTPLCHLHGEKTRQIDHNAFLSSVKKVKFPEWYVNSLFFGGELEAVSAGRYWVCSVLRCLLVSVCNQMLLTTISIHPLTQVNPSVSGFMLPYRTVGKTATLQAGTNILRVLTYPLLYWMC